ncbi:hypothetical protein [Cellulomonas soli]
MIGELNGKRLCRDLAETFTELAPERVWTEWHKVAAKGTHLSAALTALEETGWVRHFPPWRVCAVWSRTRTGTPRRRVHPRRSGR